MPAPNIQLSQSVVVNHSLPASNGAGVLNTTGIDMLDQEGVVTFIQHLGAVTGTLTVNKLQESDTVGGTYTDVDQAGQAFGQTANTITAVYTNVSERKRFLRYTGTVTTGPVLLAISSLGFKKYRP